MLRGQYYPNIKARQRTTREEHYRSICLTSINTKLFNKILVKQIKQHIIKIIYHDQVGFIQGNLVQLLEIN